MEVHALAPEQTVLIIQKKEELEEEEPEESSWDSDLEEAWDYHARAPVPMRRHVQPPKVFPLQPHRPPAGWPTRVWPELPSKPDLVSKNKYVGQEQEQRCAYLEPVQRHIYMEPTPRDDQESEPKTPLVMVQSKQ